MKKTRPSPRMSGIFDTFFGKKKGEEPKRSIFEAFGGKSQLPAIRREPELPSPVSPTTPREERGLSMFDVFRPPVPQGPREEEKASLFQVFEPAAPAPAVPPASAAAAGPGGAWSEMFESEPEPQRQPETERQPERSLHAMFKPFEEETPPPQWQPLRAPPIARWHAIWPFPTPEMLAAHFHRTLDLGKIFAHTLAIRKSPEFRYAIEEQAGIGQPAMVPVWPVVTKEVYTEFSQFYNIPMSVFDSFFQDVRTPEDQKEAENKVWTEVIAPLNMAVADAFQILQPRDLPGWFTVAWNDEEGGYWLYYVEAFLPPAGGLTYGGSSGE